MTSVTELHPRTRSTSHDDGEHRVLRYRPRTSAHPPGEVAAAEDVAADFHADGESDDFRHRMLTNLAALAFTLVLISIGIWLAFKISDLRKNQDCALTGRRNCVPISTSHS